MKFLRKLAILAVVLVGATVLCWIVLWSLARYQRRRFESMASRAAQFQAGKSTVADAESFLKTFEREALVVRRDCTPTECRYETLISNFLIGVPKDDSNPLIFRWRIIEFLAKLGIRPAVAVTYFTIKSSVVQGIYFGTAYDDNRGEWMWASWEKRVELDDYASCWALAASHPTYIVSHTRTGSGGFSGRSVFSVFSERAAQSVRSRCQRIDFECMTQARECGYLAFMPQVKEDIEAEERAQKNNGKQYEATLSDCRRKKGLIP